MSDHFTDKILSVLTLVIGRPCVKLSYSGTSERWTHLGRDFALSTEVFLSQWLTSTPYPLILKLNLLRDVPCGKVNQCRHVQD